MEYPQVTIQNAAEELNRLNSAIESKGRSMVQDAIRAGEILARVKDSTPHGDFLPWIKENCSFSHDSARNYMRVFSHHDKIRSVRNLQEAYRQIETIEKQEKQTEEQKARQRVEQYLKTETKPEGWRRGTDDKIAEEERQRDKRIEAAKAEMEAARIRREHEQAQREREAKEQRQSTEDLYRENEFISQMIGQVTEHNTKRREFKDRIRLSDGGKDDAFVDAIMDYLDELPDDNRRIEACTNIIKVARGISAQLQRGE